MKYVKLAFLVLSFPVVFWFGYVWAVSAYGPPPEYVMQKPLVDEDKLFTAVNNWRRSIGKEEYAIDPLLCGYANRRAKEIQSNFSHDLAKKSYDEIRKIKFYEVLGENIASDFTDEQSTLTGWLNSASHAAALKEDYKYSCISCKHNYCVQLFAR